MAVATRVTAAGPLDALLFGINDEPHIREGIHHRLHRAQLLPLLGRAFADEDGVRLKRR